ncbi:hypothetical protein [Tumebacillus flagellatus]|nr:hypothetical protein [Tumebacillus flagellatus]
MDLRAVGDGNENFIEAYPAVYDQMTNIGGCFNEIMEREAFDG